MTCQECPLWLHSSYNLFVSKNMFSLTLLERVTSTQLHNQEQIHTWHFIPHGGKYANLGTFFIMTDDGRVLPFLAWESYWDNFPFGNPESLCGCGTFIACNGMVILLAQTNHVTKGNILKKIFFTYVSEWHGHPMWQNNLEPGLRLGP